MYARHRIVNMRRCQILSAQFEHEVDALFQYRLWKKDCAGPLVCPDLRNHFAFGECSFKYSGDFHLSRSHNGCDVTVLILLGTAFAFFLPRSFCLALILNYFFLHYCICVLGSVRENAVLLFCDTEDSGKVVFHPPFFPTSCPASFTLLALSCNMNGFWTFCKMFRMFCFQFWGETFRSLVWGRVFFHCWRATQHFSEFLGLCWNFTHDCVEVPLIKFRIFPPSGYILHAFFQIWGFQFSQGLFDRYMWLCLGKVSIYWRLQDPDIILMQCPNAILCFRICIFIPTFFTASSIRYRFSPFSYLSHLLFTH